MHSKLRETKVGMLAEVAVVSVANSEEDAAYGWMSLITRGMQQVLFMAVEYDAALDRFDSLTAPVMLCG